MPTATVSIATYPPSHLRQVSGFYAIPHAAIREVGPASITLGLIFYVADAKTFSTYKSVKTLAEFAAIPATTIKKHLAKLCSAGWLENQGRQRNDRSQRKRRTVTYALTSKARASKTPYAAWPRWLACWPEWLSREQTLVYAVLFNRACLVESIQENEENCSGACDERSYMSNTEIRRQTGLSRNTIQRAIEVLTDPHGPLLWETEAWEGQEHGGYILVLPDFAPDRLK